MSVCSASNTHKMLYLVVSRLDENKLIMINEELKISKRIFNVKIKGFQCIAILILSIAWVIALIYGKL